MTWAYYNDNDKYCAQWLRNLIAAGEIPPGDVDERDIQEIRASDLRGYATCHFFAGIGGWPLALDLAGWGDRSVWTGSCPCQPLSSAGQRKGHADERHLWPAFYDLIAECRPPVVLGEQVASKDGREWLAGVRADLEGLGYAVGAADLPAAGAGAKHNRSRLWWLAHPGGEGLQVGRYSNKNGSDAPHISAGERPPRLSPRLVPASQWSYRPLLGRGIHGIPARVAQVRAYGNAIVPPLAAVFIRAVMETT